MPADQRQVRPDRSRRDEPRRETLGGLVAHTLEDAVFQPREHHGNAHLGLVCAVIAAVDRAADRAALAMLPILALDDLVRRFVREDLGQL